MSQVKTQDVGTEGRKDDYQDIRFDVRRVDKHGRKTVESRGRRDGEQSGRRPCNGPFVCTVGPPALTGCCRKTSKHTDICTNMQTHMLACLPPSLLSISLPPSPFSIARPVPAVLVPPSIYRSTNTPPICRNPASHL